MKKRVALVCQRTNNIPFVFESAKKNNVELVLIHSPDEQAATHFDAVIGAEALPVFDDPDQALEQLDAVAQRWQLNGIVTQREEAIVWTARAAARLGLPGLSLDAAIACRDKGTMRKLFQEHGLNTPRFVRVQGQQDIDQCSEINFPCVVKPASGVNSAGVQLAYNKEELERALAHVERLNDEVYTRFSKVAEENFAGIVVEEFLTGPEYVVELFAHRGEIIPLNCGYKGQPEGPFFEETVYMGPPLEPEAVIQALQAVAVDGMRALGMTEGPGHCELRMDDQGRIYILEIGARIGGSGCAHFNVEGALGIDFANLHYNWSMNALDDSQWPPRPDQPGRAASTWIIPLGGSGTFRSVDGLETVKSHPDCDRIIVFAEAGKVYRPFPYFDGFIGIVFAVHKDAKSGFEFFEYLERTLKVNWD